MAINKNTTSLDSSKNSIAILVIRTTNQINHGYRPAVAQLRVLNRQNNQMLNFNCRNSVYASTNKYFNHLVSMPLPPGEYEIKEFSGYAQAGGAVGAFVAPANFRWRISALFELAPQEVTYIGHLEATNRERGENERSAGGAIPIIPQSASGFSRGTFDVTCSDRYTEDIETISKDYPWIKNYNINNSTLKLVDNGNPNS